MPKTQIVKYRVRKSQRVGGWHIERLIVGTWVHTLECRNWRCNAIRNARKQAGPNAVLTESWENIYDKTVILTFRIREDAYRRMS